MEGISREIRLVARPQGFPGEDLFEVGETRIPIQQTGRCLTQERVLLRSTRTCGRA